MSDIKIFRKDDNDQLNFDVSFENVETLKGPLLLAQWSIKILLDNSDHPFSTNVAGGLLSAAGQNTMGDQEFQVWITQILDDVQQFMQSEQESADLPRSEKLKELQLLDISSEDPSQIRLAYRVVNQSNEQANVNLPVGDILGN